MKIARGILRTFGWGAYVFWGVLGYRGLRLIFHQENRRPWRYILVDVLVIAVFCSLLSSLGPILVDKNFGGLVGKGIINFLTVLFGTLGRAFSLLRADGGRFVLAAEPASGGNFAVAVEPAETGLAGMAPSRGRPRR